MSKDSKAPSSQVEPGPSGPRLNLSTWTYAGVGRQVVKLPLLVGALIMLTSPFAGEGKGGEALLSGFLVVLVSLTLGAFFQFVDERRA